MLKRIPLILALIIICTSRASSQHAVPNLTKQQMYADYDTLIRTLKEISPQYAFRKKVTGIDVYNYYSLNRKRIERVKSLKGFYYIVRSTLTANQDDHTGLIWRGFATEDELVKSGISPAAARLQPMYDSLYFLSSRNIHLKIPLKYLKGHYYVSQSFSYSGRIFPAGSELVACNHTPINSFVKQFYLFAGMIWDSSNKRYYSERFLSAKNLRAGDRIKFSFKDRRGCFMQANFLMQDSVMLLDGRDKKSDAGKRVAYFPEQKVLYIRLPKMEEEDTAFYPSEIRKAAANKEIAKVIIDIRGNGGGNDDVWRRLLSSIISKRIIWPLFLIANNSSMIRSHYPDIARQPQFVNVPFLSHRQYLIFFKGNDTIPVSSSSIRFDGPLFLLQNNNIYSSAGSLAALANYKQGFYTVGQPTGLQLGSGLTPLVFELPNSKILYRIEPVIDYSNVKVPNDIFHDNIKIFVPMTIDDFIRIAKEPELYSNGYLLNRDPVFKETIKFTGVKHK